MKQVKERQFILLQQRENQVFFWLDIFLKSPALFLTNKYGRLSHTETTSLVINAYY